MAYSYNRFYIGDKRIADADFFSVDPLLLTLSELQTGHRAEARVHRHPHMEFFYFKSGKGVFECGGREEPISAHDIVVVNAGCEHCLYSENGEEPLIYYNFTVDRLNVGGATHNGISVNGFEHHSFGSEENPVFPIILQMLSELKNEQCDYYSKVQALFTVLLIDLIRLFRISRPAGEGARRGNIRRLLLQTKSYIDEHYAENLSLEQLTRISLMQKSYFMHQFKKYFGTSPIRYLNRVRIENAKLLLVNTDMPVTEIAADVGFNTPAYFSEMFLRDVGFTPSAFRNRNSLL